jgi:molybdenum cofactor cytidylyltransferase
VTIPADNGLAIIVLAAGQSARLGQMKQLVSINEQSLVARQLTQALKVTSEVYCVLGFNAEQVQVQAHIEHLAIKTIINSTWSEGMASSIAKGVEALASGISAVMIVLVDQWQLTSADLLTHYQYWQAQPEAIVVAKNISTTSARENIGPPVIFPRRYFAELRQLTGNQGAKPLLEKYQQSIVRVPLSHAFIDVDTPKQLTAMYKKLGIKPVD